MSSNLKSYVREVADFPQKGIGFKDISPLIKDHLSETISQMITLFDKDILKECDYIIGPDARGFILASAIAHHLNKGVVMVRKAGKLPPPTVSLSYKLEYGEATIEMLEGEGKAIIIDDVLATGGTLQASIDLCEKAGYEVLDVAVLMDLTFLHQMTWQNKPVKSVISYY